MASITKLFAICLGDNEDEITSTPPAMSVAVVMKMMPIVLSSLMMPTASRAVNFLGFIPMPPRKLLHARIRAS
jgi:hypothetical protein